MNTSTPDFPRVVPPLQWIWWALVNTAIIWLLAIIAGLLGYSVTGENRERFVEFAFTTACFAGVLVSTGQYLLLRRVVADFGVWLGLSVLALVVSVALIVGVMHAWSMAGVLIGLLSGIGQWFVLRRRVQHAEWWILLTLIAWSILLWYGNQPSR